MHRVKYQRHQGPRRLPLLDRDGAGLELAEAVQEYRGTPGVIVLALPRGGVPVAIPVARTLDAPLDLMLVRKLGTPGQRELAMGAVAGGGVEVLNEEIIRELRIPRNIIDQVAAREQEEVERRATAYRSDRPWPDLAGRTVVLVDDGVATGATMFAAVDAVRKQGAARVVVAVPVAPAATVGKLRDKADDVICLHAPEPFYAIGNWYVDFSQVSDDDVRALLSQAWADRSAQQREPAGPF